MLLLLAVAIAFIGFSVIIIGKLFFGESWFAAGAGFILVGITILLSDLLLLTVKGILEKFKRK